MGWLWNTKKTKEKEKKRTGPPRAPSWPKDITVKNEDGTKCSVLLNRNGTLELSTHNYEDTMHHFGDANTEGNAVGAAVVCMVLKELRMMQDREGMKSA